MLSSPDLHFFILNLLMFVFVRQLPSKSLSAYLKADTLSSALIAGFFYALGSHIKQSYTKRIYKSP